MLLMIDNYDSFTYNLVQYFAKLGQEVVVKKNDKITLSSIEQLQPQYMVISPGPGNPSESGISLAAIKHFYRRIPILGVCLGHQCIAQIFGGKIQRAPVIMHGKISSLTHTQEGLFHNLPAGFDVVRYHSLAIQSESLPATFKITAHVKECGISTIMGIEHREFPLHGVQFHPESISSEYGLHLLSNFLQYKCLTPKTLGVME
ncbi:MAG: aminodeoxychorismate/anthranilate synthase component II [Pseudomonadota bacterium]